MNLITKSWRSADDRFGNLAFIGFLVVQYLDGVYTYLGFSIWGLNIEANPLIRSAMASSACCGLPMSQGAWSA